MLDFTQHGMASLLPTAFLRQSKRLTKMSASSSGSVQDTSHLHCKNSGMTFTPKKVWFHFLHWAYQKRCDFHTKKGVIFIPEMVWSSYCFWYDLHTAFGMIFILLMVWSLYHLWYDLYTAYGMIFIPLLVWYLYCLWYDLYTVYGMNIWYLEIVYDWILFCFCAWKTNTARQKHEIKTRMTPKI